MRSNTASERRMGGAADPVEVALIDSRTQGLAVRFSAKTYRMTVPADEDGLRAIARTVCDGMCRLRVLHLVVFNGERGIMLGATPLSLTSFDARAEELRGIGRNMARPGMVHLHLGGCDDATALEATMLLFGYLAGVDVMISCRGEQA